MSKTLKILGVKDPAIMAYVKDEYKILENFNGDFKVKFDIVSWEDYVPMMNKVLNGDLDYDVVMVAGHFMLKDLVLNNKLCEIDTNFSNEYDVEDILPVIKEELMIDKKQYLYPSFCDGHVLLYRKSILQKALGKLPNSVISTDELMEIASKCHGIDDMYGIALKSHPSEIFLDFLPYLRQEGFDAFDRNTHFPIFNNYNGKNALKKYLNMKEFAPKDTCNFGNEEIKDYFQNKKVAMAVTWGGQIGYVLDDNCLDKEDVGFSAIKTAWNVTWSFGINNLSNLKKEANEFLRYLTSKEIDRIVGSFAGSPVRKSTYEVDRDKYNWYDMHLELIEKNAKPLPHIVNGGSKFGVLYEVLSKIFRDEISIDEGLDQANERILQL